MLDNSKPEQLTHECYALVDCNNFYVSCERLFRPQLKGKAVVVLSNNDGVIVARSNEAKALGIAMADPVFKWKELIKRNNVISFSSNYSLYGDISGRVFATLERFVPKVDVYSIDEAFLDMRGIDRSLGAPLTKYCREMRATVLQWTGIPVSIGVGSSRTLAKLANHMAKKQEERQGVLNFFDMPNKEEEFANIEVGKIWGIGHQSVKKLNARGVSTVLQFCQLPETMVEKLLGIVGLNTQRELNGISCRPLHDHTDPQKSVLSSRSFSKAIETYPELRNRISSYISVAAKKLRAQSQVVSKLTVFVSSSRFLPPDRRYYGSETVKLSMPTSDTSELASLAATILKRIYKPGVQYKRAGVSMADLMPKSSIQSDLFGAKTDSKKDGLISVVDSLNSQLGSGTIGIASASNVKRDDGQSQRGQRYTTSWNELCRVK